MFNLIPISLLIIALGGVIFIASNHLSEFEENDETADSRFSFKVQLASWINRLPWDDTKAQSLSFTRKFLHRMRIVLLKTDNQLMKLIGKISKKDKMTDNNDLSGNTADFWKDVSDYKQEVSSREIPKSEPEVKINLTLSDNLEKKLFDIKPAVKTSKTKKSSK
ncbi:MAG: hypothetical protein AAB789_01910 [Patescibacteria group bacterium]